MLNCTYTKDSVEVFWSLRINVTTYFYVKIVLRLLSTYGLKRGKTQLEILGIVSNYTTGNGRFSGKSGQGFFVPLKRSFPLKQSLPVLCCVATRLSLNSESIPLSSQRQIFGYKAN